MQTNVTKYRANYTALSFKIALLFRKYPYFIRFNFKLNEYKASCLYLNFKNR